MPDKQSTRVLIVALSKGKYLAEIARIVGERAEIGFLGLDSLACGLSCEFVRRINKSDVLDVAEHLKRAADEFKPDRIMPFGDIAAWFLRGIAPMPLIEKSLGDPTFYRTVISRRAFTNNLRSSGVPSPRARAPLDFPFMIKSEQTAGGFGVARVDSFADLWRYALRHGLSYPFKRRLRSIALGWHDIWAPQGFELQEVIDGIPAAYTAAAQDGQMLYGKGYGGVLVPHPDGYTETWHTEPISAYHEKLMALSSSRAIKVLRISGFVSFDFMVEHDRAVMIECNPRLMQAPFILDDGAIGRKMTAAWLDPQPQMEAAYQYIA